MKVNEVKVTKTVEEVVRAEYIAYDGTVFVNKGECEKYEQSALCAVNSKLKRLSGPNDRLSDINDEGSYDNYIDIFDIQTEEDLKYLKQYVFLRCKGSDTDKTEAMNLRKVTCGHPVLLMWDYEHEVVWVYGDGSPEAYGEYFKNQYLNVIKGAQAKNGINNI